MAKNAPTIDSDVIDSLKLQSVSIGYSRNQEDRRIRKIPIYIGGNIHIDFYKSENQFDIQDHDNNPGPNAA